MILVDVLLPILGIVGVGALYRWWSGRDPRALSDIALMILSPALVFSYIVDSSMGTGELGEVGAFAVAYTAAMIAVTLLVVPLVPSARGLAGPMLLTTVFSNAGNYGLPILLFAFGRSGFERGVVFVAAQFILMYSVGVLFASWSTDRAAAIRNVLKQPAVYTGIAAVGLKLGGVEIPQPVLLPLRLTGEALVPVVLIALGMQLAATRMRRLSSFVVIGSTLRLVVGPAVGVAVVTLLGITGELADVLVLQSAAPTAVIMALFAVEYDTGPDLVSAAAFVNTLASLATVTLVIEMLDRGLLT